MREREREETARQRHADRDRETWRQRQRDSERQIQRERQTETERQRHTVRQKESESETEYWLGSYRFFFYSILTLEVIFSWNFFKGNTEETLEKRGRENTVAVSDRTELK